MIRADGLTDLPGLRARWIEDETDTHGIRKAGRSGHPVSPGHWHSEAQQRSATIDNAWQFVATPYLSGAGQNGSVRLGSVVPAQNVDATFSDIWSNLNFGAMALFEARKARWRILADAFYVAGGSE